ncbi:MAG TPA: ribose-phosphate diphosphokinase [Candidatus Sulfotelmatobacter sp.]|nr:ribose-phosphate diphosphokinase [Candidatus Sulfotelmatobacter sp.]
MSSALLFTSEPYRELGAAVCRLRGFEPGEVAREIFPDGELFQRILTPLAGRDVVLIAGTVSDEQTCRLFDLATGLVESGASRLTLVIPYFGYSTMDRAGRPGEVVTAKTRASLLSAIPPARGGTRIAILDPHSEGLPYYFRPGLGAAAIGVEPLVAEVARRLGGSDFVLASADAGRAKWVQRLADELNVRAAFAHKRRLGPERTEVVALLADVRGRQVVICDDMIRSGSTLLGAARAYREAGAAGVSAFATHGVFPGDALDRLGASGLLDRLVTTDSHPRAVALAGGFLEIESVAPLLASALRPDHLRFERRMLRISQTPNASENRKPSVKSQLR